MEGTLSQLAALASKQHTFHRFRGVLVVTIKFADAVGCIKEGLVQSINLVRDRDELQRILLGFIYRVVIM